MRVAVWVERSGFEVYDLDMAISDDPFDTMLFADVLLCQVEGRIPTRIKHVWKRDQSILALGYSADASRLITIISTDDMIEDVRSLTGEFSMMGPDEIISYMVANRNEQAWLHFT